MDKYIEELLTEMQFEFNDLAMGYAYKDIGYENKKEFYKAMASKVEELYSRLYKQEEEA